MTENDNNSIDLVAKRWAKIGDATNAAIELVHHSRKLQAGNHEVTVQDGRGAGALIAAVRSARVLNGMTKGEAEKCGLQNHGLYFRVESGKANLSPPPEGATWFHLRSIHLGNGEPGNILDKGDNVGVVTPWEWPDPSADVTAADFAAVARVVRRKQWRENSQSAGWVGLAVAEALGLIIAIKTDKAKIVALLKMWIEHGSLRVVDGLDPKGMPRKFVEVSDAIDE